MADILGLFEGQEDRGVRAVTEALERMDVASWSHERQVWIFREKVVSGETLHREIQIALGRTSRPRRTREENERIVEKSKALIEDLREDQKRLPDGI